MKDTIQIHYEQLEDVSRQFSQKAKIIEQVRKEINNEVAGTLKSGWQGEAAESFSKEWDNEVFPSIGRLSLSFDRSAEVIQEIIHLFHEAEQGASAVHPQQEVNPKVVPAVTAAVSAPRVESRPKATIHNTGVNINDHYASYQTQPENVKKIKRILSKMDVEHDPDYQPKQGQTHCSEFVQDYLRKVGAAFPQNLDLMPYVKPDGKPEKYIQASQLTAWLGGTLKGGGEGHLQGPDLGWHPVEEDQAASMASKGYVVVVGCETTKAHGHVAVVRPESTPGNIRTAQAGSSNYSDGGLSTRFQNGKGKYFVFIPPET